MFGVSNGSSAPIHINQLETSLDAAVRPKSMSLCTLCGSRRGLCIQCASTTTVVS